MKHLLILVAVTLLLVVGYVIWDNLTPSEASPGISKNINYGMSADNESVEGYRRDCNKKGGHLNTCGSSCSPGEICPDVCEFICEFE
ncbi:MAG TPA: hypothetical protein PLD54_00420 [Candidatus Levybacteria bacterium]|nr:hypothetical protein [Candidatus Levybacteria bacterium]